MYVGMWLYDWAYCAYLIDVRDYVVILSCFILHMSWHLCFSNTVSFVYPRVTVYNQFTISEQKCLSIAPPHLYICLNDLIVLTCMTHGSSQTHSLQYNFTTIINLIYIYLYIYIYTYIHTYDNFCVVCCIVSAWVQTCTYIYTHIHFYISPLPLTNKRLISQEKIFQRVVAPKCGITTYMSEESVNGFDNLSRISMLSPDIDKQHLMKQKLKEIKNSSYILQEGHQQVSCY